MKIFTKLILSSAILATGIILTPQNANAATSTDDPKSLDAGCEILGGATCIVEYMREVSNPCELRFKNGALEISAPEMPKTDPRDAKGWDILSTRYADGYISEGCFEVDGPFRDDYGPGMLIAHESESNGIAGTDITGGTVGGVVARRWIDGLRWERVAAGSNTYVINYATGHGFISKNLTVDYVVEVDDTGNQLSRLYRDLGNDKKLTKEDDVVLEIINNQVKEELQTPRKDKSLIENGELVLGTNQTISDQMFMDCVNEVTMENDCLAGLEEDTGLSNLNATLADYIADTAEAERSWAAFWERYKDKSDLANGAVPLPRLSGDTGVGPVIASGGNIDGCAAIYMDKTDFVIDFDADSKLTDGVLGENTRFEISSRITRSSVQPPACLRINGAMSGLLDSLTFSVRDGSRNNLPNDLNVTNCSVRMNENAFCHEVTKDGVTTSLEGIAGKVIAHGGNLSLLGTEDVPVRDNWTFEHEGKLHSTQKIIVGRGTTLAFKS